MNNLAPLENTLKLTSGKKNEKNITLDDLLNQVNYDFFRKEYIPSTAALEFITFVKLVNGAEGEENTSPIIHMDMIDGANSAGNNLYVSFRGSAKTSLLHEYVFLYIAVYGSFFDFGEVDVAMYVSDTIDNGVSSMRKQLEFRWQNSDFLQTYVPVTKFTETRWEFQNVDGKQFCVRGFGASSGVRGFKEYGKRPTWCHEKGTLIYSDEGTMLVEDYPDRSPDRQENGLQIHLHGLPYPEVVTHEHQYWGKKRGEKPGWIRAEDLTEEYFIGSPINMEETSIECTDRYERLEDLKKSFWFLIGVSYIRGSTNDGRVYLICKNGHDEDLIAEITDLCKKAKKRVFIYVYRDSTHYGLCDNAVTRLLRSVSHHKGKRYLPEELLDIPICYQKDFIFGYGSYDGIVPARKDFKKEKYFYLKTIEYPLILQLGEMCERIGLSYKITRIPGTEDATIKNTLKWKLTVINGSKKILGFSWMTDEKNADIFIENEFIWRRVANIENVLNRVFVPIHTKDHTYLTAFGLSHNCGLDDLMSDKNASSATIIKDIKNIIYKAARQAMHPRKRKIIWTGTPFNQRDPLYEAACSPGWSTKVYPICEQFPCERDEYKGAWEDRFGYDFVKREYDMLLSSGEISAFNQELMLKIMSDEERLIPKENINWYDRSLLLQNKGRFNFYITTDFATSEKESADYSVISVWALNNKGFWFWVDGVCKRQTMDVNIDDLFRLVQSYSPQEVGIEISGQQGGFIPWIQSEMMGRNIFFNLAKDVGSSKFGLRPNTNKLSRFNTVVPWFKANLMFFPKDLQDTAIMREAMNELELVSVEGFKSKNDDFCDTISQLASLTTWRPSEISAIKKSENGNSWIFDDLDVDEHEEAMESYLV